MYGSWCWNLSFASVGLLFIFLIGLSKNPWSIALLRGGYAFIIFFILAYMVRYLIGMLLTRDTPAADQEQQTAEEQPGAQINYVTPDGEEDLNAILREQMNHGNHTDRADAEVEQHAQAEQFQPLKPKKLVSTDKMQTEGLTRAVRHLTGE